LLSDEAKQFLSNAKNKSQLLRDALEFYIRNFKEPKQELNLNQDIVNDIKEIKNMLSLHISNGGVYKAKVISEESFDIQKEETLIHEPEIKKAIKEERVEGDKENLKEKEVVINNENESRKYKGDSGLSEEEIRRLEEMLDNSIELL